MLKILKKQRNAFSWP